MSTLTQQMEKWSGEFGKKYTLRNCFSPKELDKLCKISYGVTAVELNNIFLKGINRDIRILEVGSNMGNQLILLQEMGFKNLYGIEINNYAVELSKSRAKNINIIQGSALDIPFKDNYFDLVFTAGVLIHIHPRDIKKVITEIYRCSRKYIWGYEYYSKKYEEIKYRGNKNMMWRTDFLKLYMEIFKDLKLIKEKKLPYLDSDKIDAMFLFKKI